MPEIGRGAQVTLVGTAQGAARGALAEDIRSNTALREAAPRTDTGVIGELPSDAPPEQAPEMYPYAANDVAAAALGIPVGGLYRNTAGLQQRQS